MVAWHMVPVASFRWCPDKAAMKRISKGKLPGFLVAACVMVGIAGLGTVWLKAGLYGLHVLFRHGGTYWVPVAADSERLSPSMRLALRSDPVATPGPFAWRPIANGFEVADLPAIVEGRAVDHILLARIAPDRYRFAVYNASAGDKDLDQWMAHLGAALVVNGSYYGRRGTPDTPFLSQKTLLGPRDYNARAGAFVASPASVGIVDLAKTDWKQAFQGAENAMVSYPLLVEGNATRVSVTSRWLANRSFVGEDADGRVIIGTTTDAFFSLQRLAQFLLGAPLDLTAALNLDGGPVASQGISLNGYDRRTYGQWELEVTGDKVQLLTWPYGTVAMPVVLAVFPK
jgi:Phosphodiester glycosidase